MEGFQMMRFFNWFFFFISLGALLAVTVLVYIQDNVGRPYGHGACAAAIAAGLVVFLAGTRFKKLAGSPLTQVAAVVVAAWRKRRTALPTDTSMLYDIDVGKVAATDGSSTKKSLTSLLSGMENLETVITDLPNSLIIEILSRLPPKSLCHCMCVSPDWYNLISDLDNLKQLQQTLAGFFFDTKDQGRSPKRARQNVNEGQPLIDPSFSFLPPELEHVRLKDSCDGLLLCSSRSPFHLVVCNPATKRWVMVPNPPGADYKEPFALAFDRNISQNFHVFQIVRTQDIYVAGTKIYSSKTGEWSYKEAGWGHRKVFMTRRHVFHQGMMHFVGTSSILAVDTEEHERIIPLPDAKSFYKLGYVGQSEGHLYYMSQSVDQPSVWFLENYDTDEWTLKHRTSHNQLLGLSNQHVYYYEYHVISGHPDCSLFYIANHRKNLLMAYDIGREESEEHVAHAFVNLGRGDLRSVFPYVPLYQDLDLGCIAWHQGSPNELVLA